ncbi:MAG: 50S ribosomal protein L11 methyltransferase [Deferribacteraceae bacterium]|jgi:ribosomal protein L11 methyltransferase|nr:50S ribosomal protein L11 methyltransferase [Deferribacteraceae bacterium]
MLEYRLSSMPASLKKKLTGQGINIIEEKFNQRKSWLLYVTSNIDRLLNRYEIDYIHQDIKDTGWDTLWRDYIKDGWLTDNVYFCFENKDFRDKRLSIQINPALAFGTGGHSTTQIAARLLERVANRRTVLDIGTGSGILAILASLTGAKKVFACDTDSVAIMNAKENTGLNSRDNIYLWTGGIESFAVKSKPSVVVANIISSVLKCLHPYVLALNPEYIIYSGLTLKEKDKFFSSIPTKGYKPDEILVINEWCGIRFKMI